MQGFCAGLEFRSPHPSDFFLFLLLLLLLFPFKASHQILSLFINKNSVQKVAFPHVKMSPQGTSHKIGPESCITYLVEADAWNDLKNVDHIHCIYPFKKVERSYLSNMESGSHNIIVHIVVGEQITIRLHTMKCQNHFFDFVRFT